MDVRSPTRGWRCGATRIVEGQKADDVLLSVRIIQDDAAERTTAMARRSGARQDEISRTAKLRGAG